MKPRIPLEEDPRPKRYLSSGAIDWVIVAFVVAGFAVLLWATQ